MGHVEIGNWGQNLHDRRKVRVNTEMGSNTERQYHEAGCA
jgi:hypothetical protein